MAFRQPDHIMPIIVRFPVIRINRYIQTGTLQLDYFRQKFPCPGNGFLLKVITKREIPKHFKKGMMPCCTADIFNIACADTFLTGRHTMAGRLNLPRKIRFQWRHPCADQKQAGIIFWNQRKTFQPQMFFLRFEKDKYASRISLPFMICPLRYFDFVVFVYYTMQT